MTNTNTQELINVFMSLEEAIEDCEDNHGRSIVRYLPEQDKPYNKVWGFAPPQNNCRVLFDCGAERTVRIRYRDPACLGGRTVTLEP